MTEETTMQTIEDVVQVSASGPMGRSVTVGNVEVSGVRISFAPDDIVRVEVDYFDVVLSAEDGKILTRTVTYVAGDDFRLSGTVERLTGEYVEGEMQDCPPIETIVEHWFRN